MEADHLSGPPFPGSRGPIAGSPVRDSGYQQNKRRGLYLPQWMAGRSEIPRDPFGGETGLQDAVVQGDPPVGVAVQVDAGIGGEP